VQGTYPGAECGTLEGKNVDMFMEFDPPVHITSITWFCSGVNGSSPLRVFINDVHVWSGILLNGERVANAGNVSVSKIAIKAQNSFNFCVDGVRLRGKGANPFGASNCV
jgi:hypothetical protein